MPRVGFEPTISAGERPKTYALDRTATGTGKIFDITLYILFYFMYTANFSKTNEISFNTLLLVIAYYVYRQYVTL